ncbi:hypothetical protein THRCLA_04814 [Thraustotheca clavata]|uniref:Fe2OG dioxygenase domain-containing protein n=1 Tax=Thraustotheca clavata TaxID=74557 RepID=A0A1V9ZXV3_9STRA|nr:hypothetical protein THRCLA_04814 [Thraustotheca clavata]
MPYLIIMNKFKAAEKYYRHRGKSSKDKRNEQVQDFSDVFDVHDLINNTIANQRRLRCTDAVKNLDRSMFVILEPKDAQVIEIDGVDGLKVLRNAMPIATQVEWAFRAVREYSKLRYNNMTNLANDPAVTKTLWEQAWKEDKFSNSRTAWKAFHSLRWANIGAHYDWTAREYVDDPEIPQVPEELLQLTREVFALTGMAECKMVESGIINFYPSGTYMGGHLDNAEEDMVNPIVSLSLGTQCIYLQGGLTRDITPTPLWLRSGDIVLMGGNARRCFHGVPLVTSTIPDSFIKHTQELKMRFDQDEVEAFQERQFRGKLPLSTVKLNAQLEAMLVCINGNGLPWDAGLLLTTNKHIQYLNRTCRKKDKPTDILSFPNYKITLPGVLPDVQNEEERYLGDMFISIPYVQSFCKHNDTTLDERMPILLAHGLCHLLGYDHEVDKEYQVMQEKENELLAMYRTHLAVEYQ